jgi:hypothetical protein
VNTASQLWALPLALVLGSACARYVTRPVPCEAGPPAPALRSDTAYAPRGAIVGFVDDAEGRGAVAQAMVSLYGDSSWRSSGQVLRGDTTGADGRFGFDGLPPGGYVLRIRRIGYESVPYELLLERSAGRAVVVPVRPMATDGCGFAVIRERLPWWRVW